MSFNELHIPPLHTIVNLLKCFNIYAGRTDGHTGEYIAKGIGSSNISYRHTNIYTYPAMNICVHQSVTDERGRFILYTQQHARIIIIQFSLFFFLGGGGIDVFIAARSIWPF